MIQLGSIIKVADKTGVILGQCIKVLGYSRKNFARYGDIILIAIKWINKKRIRFLRARFQRRYRLGALHRALLIRSKMNFCKFPGVFVCFDKSAIILVTKKGFPVSRRIYGPVLKELCIKKPAIGCISKCIV